MEYRVLVTPQEITADLKAEKAKKRRNQRVEQKLKQMNKAFIKLSKKGKRIAIAQDALFQLRRGMFIAGSGYLMVVSDKADDGDIQLNEAVSSGQVVCEGCAKGALFCAHVMFTNHLKLNKAKYHTGASHMMRKLSEVFESKQLHLIETAYECEKMNTPPSQAKKAIVFGKKYRSDRSRLIGILNNIIDNKGTFKP